MIDTLRAQLNALRGAIGHVDGVLAECDPGALSNLLAAQALVELDKLGTRLGKLVARLEGVAGNSDGRTPG